MIESNYAQELSNHFRRGADIYKHEQTNGVAVGYKLPEKGDAYFWLFKNILDDSLDLVELEEIYKRYAAGSLRFKINARTPIPLPS